MKKYFEVALILLLLLLSCLSAVAQDRLEGDWVGGFMLDGNWVTLNVRFVSTQGSIGGTASVVSTSYEGQNGIALKAISLKGSRLHFESPTDRGNIIFDGRLTGSTIYGTYLSDRKRGTF